MKAWRRWAGAALVAVGLPLAFAAPAAAVGPTRVAWWSEAAVAGTAVPAPMTTAGGLQVTEGVTGPESFGAVHYDLADAPAGQKGPTTLTLVVTPNSTVGSPALRACPTLSESWRAGGDQPVSAAPAYDCTSGVAGFVSADHTSVGFALPVGMRDARGDVDVAIVPVSGSEPFQVSFDAPGTSSLTVAAPTSALPASPAAKPAPAAAVAHSKRSAPVRPVPVPIQLPEPALAGGLSAPPPVVPAPTPVVAPATPTAKAASTPAVAAPARSSPGHAHKVALVLLFLVVDLVIVASLQPPRAPRLLGGVGRGRPEPEPAAAVGGLGRFARPRVTPPRRIV